MTDNCEAGYEGGGWLAQVKDLVEQDGTPFLCLYLDQKTQRVNFVSDCESQKKLRDSKALTELEDILKSTNEKKTALQFYNHQHEVVSSCHQSQPSKYHKLSWVKNQQICLKGQILPENCYNNLPVEVLRMIFGFLKPTDLRKVLLVSHSWKSVAEEPALWAGFGLPVKSRKSSQNLKEFLKTTLSSKVQRLTIARRNAFEEAVSFGFSLSDEHFNQFLSLDLSSIAFWEVALPEVSDQLISKLVNSCRECEIIEYYKRYGSIMDPGVNEIGLGVQKLRAIFDEMQHQTKLKSFELSCVVDRFPYEPVKIDLSSIPSKILATAFSKLDVLGIENVHLSFEQLDTIFAEGFVNLSSLSFQGINMDAAKTRNLFENLEKSSRLQSLNLSKADGREISSLSRFINKLQSVNLEEVLVESHQLEDIFQGILGGDSVIKHLRICNVKNLDDVNAEVLSRAVNKLESLSFDGKMLSNCLSESQTKKMFEVMSLETSLKSLGKTTDYMPVDAYDHIGEVDPEVFAVALNNLESTRLDFGTYENGCYLATAQIFAFFKQLSLKSNLKTIIREDHPDLRM